MKNNVIEILLVEDSPTDRIIAKEGLQHARLISNLHVVEDGIQAMDFLHRVGAYANAPRPTLILLDLNLPRKDGREVLLEIKGDLALRRIPVVVMTTSAANEDVTFAYDHHANCYVTKPVDFNNFLKLIFDLEHFWFKVVTLPTHQGEF